MRTRWPWFIPLGLLLAQVALAMPSPTYGIIPVGRSVYLKTNKARFGFDVPANSLRRLSDNTLVTHGPISVATLPLSGNGGGLGGGPAPSNFYTPIDQCKKNTSDLLFHLVNGVPPSSAALWQRAPKGAGTSSTVIIAHDTRMDWMNTSPVVLVPNQAVNVPIQLAELALRADSVVTLVGLGTYRTFVDQKPTDLGGFPNGNAAITATSTNDDSTMGTYHATFTVKPRFTFVPDGSSPGPATLYYDVPAPLGFHNDNVPFILIKNFLPAIGVRGMLLAAAMLLLTGTLVLGWRRRREGDVAG